MRIHVYEELESKDHGEDEVEFGKDGRGVRGGAVGVAKIVVHLRLEGIGEEVGEDENRDNDLRTGQDSHSLGPLECGDGSLAPSLSHCPCRCLLHYFCYICILLSVSASLPRPLPTTAPRASHHLKRQTVKEPPRAGPGSLQEAQGQFPLLGFVDQQLDEADELEHVYRLHDSARTHRGS